MTSNFNNDNNNKPTFLTRRNTETTIQRRGGGADARGDKSLVGVCELNRNVLRADLNESTIRIFR